MKKIFNRLLPIFSGKCITNNRVESKYSQIKKKGKIIKHKDPSYSDKLFLLNEYLVQHKKLPVVNLTGRPLYKYLITNHKIVEEKRESFSIKKIGEQIMISNYF